MSRRGVVLQVAEDAYRGRESRSKLVGADDFEALQDEFWEYGPEPVGFVFEIDDDALEELPDEWAVRSKWWLDGAGDAPD